MKSWVLQVSCNKVEEIWNHAKILLSLLYVDSRVDHIHTNLSWSGNDWTITEPTPSEHATSDGASSMTLPNSSTTDRHFRSESYAVGNNTMTSHYDQSALTKCM